MWPHLESPVGQKKEDDSSSDEAAAAEAAEEKSDSGDSLFITQRPVPEAVRAGRRHRHRQSTPSSSDAPSPSLQQKSKRYRMDKEMRIKYKKSQLAKSSLPRFSFPFLKGHPQMSGHAMLSVQQNTSLHNSLMGGFLECVKEQWQGFLFESFATSSLPTVDKEGQCIPPLTEDEEETSEDKDVKVVPKKCFVASTKATSKQSQCSQEKEQPGRRRGGVLDERDDKKCLTPTVTSRTNRYLARTARKELCIDSDAADCELQRSPRKGEALTTASDVETDVSHTDHLLQTESQNLLHSLPDAFTDTDNHNVCDESTAKERGKDHESVEEEAHGQIQEEPEDLHAATSVNEEEEETSSLAQDNWAEPSASQATDELEFNERSHTENVSLDDAMLIQEEGDTRESAESDVRMEESVLSVSCNVENYGKRKRSREGDEDVEQLQSSDSAEIQKKRKKEPVLPEGCEEEEASHGILDMTPPSTGQSEKSGDNTSASEETLESSYSGRTKNQKKQQTSSDGATQDGDDGEDVNFSNDAVTSAKSTEVSLIKTVSDGQDLSDTSVENENLDNTQETTEGPEDENTELMMMKKKTVSDEVDSCYPSEENKKLQHVDDTQKTIEGLKDQNAELETPRKKRKKKSAVSDGEDISHTREENENTDDVGNSQTVTESPKDQNVELETPKKKKKKKKTVSDEVDISCTYVENEKVDDTQKTSEAPEDENAELETPKKKKKKTVADEVDISYTPEENENIRDVDNTQKTTKSLEDENTDVVTTKKKKKKKKIVSEVEPSYTSEENKNLKDVDDIQKMAEDLEEQNTELETAKKKKKKKKKKTVSSEVEISHTSQENEMVENVDTTHKTTEGLEDQNTEVVAMKKKKKKKKKMVSNGKDISYTLEENEKVENVDETQKGTGGPEDQNAKLVTTEKKKKKKKIVSDGEGVSFTLEETEKVEKVEDVEKTTESLEDQNAELLSKKKKKKKKKTVSDENVSNIPEENKRVEDVDNAEKAKEDLEGQDPERVTKKKKKKKIGEITIRNISKDSAAQSDDSVSVQKKGKKRTSSFLVADAEENNVQTYRGQKSSSQSLDVHVWCAQKHGVSAGGFETESAEITGSLEETNDGVRKKKKNRKRKMGSLEQDSVEKDHEQDFEEPNKARLHETTNTGAKKTRTGNESVAVTPVERLQNSTHEEHRPTDEAVMLKKKKKKRCKDTLCHVIQDNPPAANEDVESEKSTLNSRSSASHKKKGEHVTSPLVAKDKHGCTKEKLNVVAYTSSEQPENKLTDKKKKKKRKSLMMF